MPCREPGLPEPVHLCRIRSSPIAIWNRWLKPATNGSPPRSESAGNRMKGYAMSRARITGTGSSLPDKIITNRDLEQMVETSDEWITTQIGKRRQSHEGVCHVESPDYRNRFISAG